MEVNELRNDITKEMHLNRIFITDVAKKLNRHRVTIHVWLRDITPERKEMLELAIKEIIEERESK